MRIQEVIRRPLITEKSTVLRDDRNIIAFEVDRRANKIEVKRGDPSGLTMTEFRLCAGFINCSVPFWGARHIHEVVRNRDADFHGLDFVAPLIFVRPPNQRSGALA